MSIFVPRNYTEKKFHCAFQTVSSSWKDAKAQCCSDYGDVKIKTKHLFLESRVAVKSSNAWFDPNPDSSFLVSVGKFTPSPLRGAYYSFLSQKLVSSLYIELRHNAQGLKIINTRQLRVLNFRASKYPPPSHLSHKCLTIFQFQILTIFFFRPLKQADYIDMASRYPKTFSWLIWNFFQTALQQIQTAKTPTRDTFFHFSPLSPLLFSTYSSSTDIQRR